MRDRGKQASGWLLLVGLTGLLVWGHWNALRLTARSWENPLYSHGYLIPLFSLLLLWIRRQPLEEPTPRARLAGLVLLAGALALRLAATHYAIVTVDLVSFVPALAGVWLLVGGTSLLRWAGPAIAFLVFMFPLPTFIKENVLMHLQRIATVMSTYVLQTFGVAAHSEGNRISIGELQMGVVDACSGLRMSTNLLALAVALVMLTKRPWWERLALLLSAVPIAIIVNVVRITATGLFHLAFGSEWVDSGLFHDAAGFLMMPLAVGLMYLEMVLLSHLFIEVEQNPSVATVALNTARTKPAKSSAPIAPTSG